MTASTKAAHHSRLWGGRMRKSRRNKQGKEPLKPAGNRQREPRTAASTKDEHQPLLDKERLCKSPVNTSMREEPTVNANKKATPRQNYLFFKS
jgi:hypothetical protein